MKRWAALMMALTATAGHAATYTVAAGGNDGNPGSEAAPWRTIGKAASAAKAGDTVLVRSGTYIESVTINQSGTAAAPIRFVAFPGENPVIDGQGKLPAAQWYGLIYVNGAYVEVSGFELKNSAQRGMVLYGSHDTAREMTVHDTRDNGILIEGDDCTVESSEVYRTAMSNYNSAGGGMWAGGLSAARGVDGIASRNSVRRNRVHDNWGEGLSTFEAEGTVIEDNVVYNNFSVNLYVSDVRNATVQRNIVYNTAGAPLRNGNPASGITLADEVASKPRSSGNRIINNLLKDVPLCAFCWTMVAGSKLDNALVAHNTVVNGAINIGPVSGTTRVLNNLANAVVSGGPSIDAGYFRLKSASPVPAISDVPTDFFAAARPNPATAGAIEFASSGQPPPVPVPGSTNLAVGKTAFASSIESSSLDAKYAVDGLKTTRWSSQFSDPQSLTVDLGKLYSLSLAHLEWETAAAKAYTIEGSVDGKSWFPLYSTTSGIGGTVDHSLSGVARFVRMSGTTRTTGWGYSLWEFSVDGVPFPCP